MSISYEDIKGISMRLHKAKRGIYSYRNIYSYGEKVLCNFRLEVGDTLDYISDLSTIIDKAKDAKVYVDDILVYTKGDFS